MNVFYKVYTDVGGRSVNEDAVGVLERNGEYFFVLADGLGGHGKGEVASEVAVKAALDQFVAITPDSLRDADQTAGSVNGIADHFPEGAFTAAQEAVLNAQKTGFEFSDMKTTLVVLWLSDGQARWGHIGDSRLYYFQDEKLKGRTLDHSVPQMLVNTGEISEKEIRFHEDRNRLLRVIGAEWGRHAYDLSDAVDMKDGQAFLLCSDGFWELIDEKEMQKELKNASSVEEWMDSMISIVRGRMENGKPGSEADNNSAIAVWITR